MKTIPQRTCIGCGEKKDKQELIRIVHTPEGEYCLDATGRKNGRGAYICRDIKCLETAMKRKALQRAFKEEVPGDTYQKLQKEWEQLDK